MRIISDELHARIIKELAKNETVAVFQQLLLAPKTEEKGAVKEAEQENGETQKGVEK
jgi:hypothetical protein